MTTKPLQTHGLFRLTWQPPRGDRFCSYDRTDEAWMRPLGLGRLVKEPEPLFDVRLEDGTLVGYTAAEPDGSLGRHCIPVVKSPPRWVRSGYSSGGPAFDVIELRIGRYAVHREVFSCWMVYSAADAAYLLRAGWIKAIGEDNIERVIYDLERREAMNSHRTGRRAMKGVT